MIKHQQDIGTQPRMQPGNLLARGIGAGGIVGIDDHDDVARLGGARRNGHRGGVRPGLARDPRGVDGGEHLGRDRKRVV